MEIKIPKETEMILIQPRNPWRDTGGDKFDYRPPILVHGEAWSKIDRHQRGIMRAEGEDRFVFTGVVPSADHDDKKHVDEGHVIFGKMKYRCLEERRTRWCYEYTTDMNAIADKYGVTPGAIVKDASRAKGI